MKLFLVILAVTAAFAAPNNQYEPIVTDYHEEIGIPEATRIKAAEQAMDFDGSRIAGGAISNLGQFPYMGGLIVTLIARGQSVCGSTLISNTRAVTAAHCWRTTQAQGILITAVFGSTRLFSGGTRVNTNNVKTHENYNMNNLNNDIAVLVLPDVVTDDNIKPISLATGSNTYVGVTVTAVGFGRTGDTSAGQITTAQILRHVQLTVISNQECSGVYGSSTVLNTTLCVSGANARSTCSGDSGGPLVVDNVLVGVASFNARAGCEQGLPAGFSRVTSYNTWINAQL